MKIADKAKEIFRQIEKENKLANFYKKQSEYKLNGMNILKKVGLNDDISKLSFDANGKRRYYPVKNYVLNENGIKYIFCNDWHDNDLDLLILIKDKMNSLEYIQKSNKKVFNKLGMQSVKSKTVVNINSVISFFKGNGNSKSQEKFAEYSFLRDLILDAALQKKKIGISRSDFDAFGFDVLIGFNEKFYPIQLKAFNGKTSNWDVYKDFLQKENSKIILVQVVPENDIITTKYFLFQIDKVSKAINTKPKVNHPEKCNIKRGDCKQITKNLLTIFD